jgi:hypothetical protein
MRASRSPPGARPAIQPLPLGTRQLRYSSNAQIGWRSRRPLRTREKRLMGRERREAPAHRPSSRTRRRSRRRPRLRLPCRRPRSLRVASPHHAHTEPGAPRRTALEERDFAVQLERGRHSRCIRGPADVDEEAGRAQARPFASVAVSAVYSVAIGFVESGSQPPPLEMSGVLGPSSFPIRLGFRDFPLFCGRLAGSRLRWRVWRW